MNMLQFLEEESGAVTVDWTVMTAAIVGLGIATYGVVSGGIKDLSGDTSDFMATDLISTAFITAPTVLSQKPFMSAEIGDPVCTISGDMGVCTGGYSSTTAYYNMSDGTQWSRETRTGEGEGVFWRDSDGKLAEGSDVPVLPDSVPMEEFLID